MRRSLAPSSYAHLPPEIWQDVFYYVNADAWLGNEEILEEKFKRIELIRNINLTCRTFRCLAQPLLCHTLKVYPFTRGSLRGSPARIALREDIAEDNIQRLMFFASDRIAPYVRNIFVDLGRYRGGPHADDCNFVLRSLVRRLHHFIGLERLVFTERLGLGFDDFVAPIPSYAPTQVTPLTHYIGPRALFHLLPSTPTLRTLHLLSLEESGFDDPVHLIPALSARDITSQVAWLTLSIDFLTEDIFRNIFSIFPRLSDIRMTTSKSFFGDVSVVPVSNAQLSCGILKTKLFLKTLGMDRNASSARCITNHPRHLHLFA
jgi:hypothetical protein